MDTVEQDRAQPKHEELIRLLLSEKRENEFLEIGRLLAECKERQYFRALKYASFKQYVENELKSKSVSYGHATRYIGVYELLGMPVRKTTTLFPVFRNDFQRRRQQTCWTGGPYVASNGNVLPCAAARQLVVGSLAQSNLETAVSSDAMQRLWQLAKEHVRTCQDCEYRYACVDCWVRVLTAAGSPCEKPPWCTHDPYAGEWHSDMPSAGLDGLALVRQPTRAECWRLRSSQRRAGGGPDGKAGSSG